MSFTIGNDLRFTVFGESHGPAVGGVIDGFPSGFALNLDGASKWMERRRPGQSEITTRRNESDIVSVLSGLSDGYTNGGPLAFYINNSDVISEHYSELKYKPRPGHADFSMLMKYGKHRPFQGGGFLSGRLTAPLVFAGATCIQLLEKYNITITSYIDRIGDTNLDHEVEIRPEDAYSFKTRIPDQSVDEAAYSAIRAALGRGDSLGSSVRTVVTGLPPGIGEPIFDSMESEISRMMFSIPAIKGIEFGLGFDFASSAGSTVRDEMYVKEGKVSFLSNNNGGILGGISNGMPMTFRVAVKPTSSIRMEERTVNLETMEDTSILIKGRHDPCIGIRALPVIQTATAIVIADFMITADRIPRVLT
ncbi:MAG: chorismate synthase [Thermoplasmataceae archaeon]